MNNVNISEYLKRSGMRQRQLAEAVGVQQSMISMIRHGKCRPSPRLAARIEAITGIPLRTLLGLDSVENDVRPGNAQQG